ncbi:MAG: aminotransferase class V-fold PLP-dependent enzyme [Thermodesulfobacteriota bacterium]
MAIYLDHAATSFPKPPSVYQAIMDVLRRVGGSPGRSDHRAAREASQIVQETREKIARLFAIPQTEQVIFTHNATEAINLGLKGLLSSKDHVLISSMEHNSVVRPLRRLEEIGVKFSIVPCSREGYLDPAALKKGLQPKTKLIVLTHASNVTGTIFPIEEIGHFARSRGIFFMVDAAQTAGLLPIDVQKMKIDLLACPGHKSLYGPQGTGFLYVSPEIDLKPLLEGGTGTNSESDRQPKDLPFSLESGTLNTPGIAGLGAGISFIMKEGLEKIWRQESQLTKRLLKGLQKISGLKIYGSFKAEERVPVISFNLNSIHPGHLAYLLDEIYNIGVRAGLHCAPHAHRSLGTFPYGAVRVSLGLFNKIKEVEALLKALRDISRRKI